MPHNSVGMHSTVAATADPLSDPALFPLGDLKFKSANQAQVRTTPNAKDVAAMVRWIQEGAQNN